MIIEFTKMHGTLNDFVVIDNRENRLAATAEIAKRLLDRRGGIGGDQLLVIRNAENADFEMRIYNADGSEVEMCGNGIRCAALFARHRGIVSKDDMTVWTLAGIMRPVIEGDVVVVDMGPPEFDAPKIPVNLEGEVMDHPIEIDDTMFKISCVSMGNPHCVIEARDPDEVDLHYWGPIIETLPLFPKRTNVEFVKVTGPGEIRMRVWERGSGETLACGTGACASAVICAKKGLCDREVTVHLDGGNLNVRWSEKGTVYLIGPAAFVFEGKVEI